MKNKELDINELWYLLIDYNYFTVNELRLVTDLKGYNIDTLNDAIYARYGYRDYKQLLNEMEGE